MQNNFKDNQILEKYSSAITMSDMEIFIFPELLFPFVCANIMSPILWQWKNDPWFSDIEKLSPYRRILKLKQYIIDHFIFNLDLDTWGLTTKEKELARFSSFVSPSAIAQSNALFGYEGDKYYFDIDIRRHFGLDKYSSNIIPYWKTETIEAMEAFKYKPQYSTGAGECVSLATLYAAALFVVCKIPLEKIFILTTPLHSQTFIDLNEGILTNNRRIVTKKMWFNGTDLSQKARRALTYEKVTIVAHNTGYIHTLFETSTISKSAYENFCKKLSDFLVTDINIEILANFLRDKSKFQKCFQLRHSYNGKLRFIEAEKVYAYEHSSSYKVSDKTREKLLQEIDEDEFYANPIPNRLILEEVESFFKSKSIKTRNISSLEEFKKHITHDCLIPDEVIKELISFCHVIPKLPSLDNKKFVESEPITLNPNWNREQIIEYFKSIREKSLVADYIFYAFRDLRLCSWKPFLKAALERNPVCIEATKDLEISQIYNKLINLPNISIYDGTRLAQPDELWNFGRGDGLEKALCLLNIIHSRFPDSNYKIKGDNNKVIISHNQNEYSFNSSKNIELPKEEDLIF
jgi:hypothetical protein